MRRAIDRDGESSGLPAESLSEWGVKAVYPDEFLIDRLDWSPDIVIRRLREQAAAIDRTLPELLRTLGKGVPRFVTEVAARAGVEIR